MDVNSFVIGYTKGKQSASGGEGGIAGFHKVQFFNDDRTTLLYTVFVPTGASAMYAGETPISTINSTLMFFGFEPSAVNVTEDMDCYATYDFVITNLNEASWKQISALSELGTAQNYFAIGETKMIHIEGKVGTVDVNGDYGVYIIGFDHNENIEGKGIHFGTFKDTITNDKDLCFADSNIGSVSTNGTKNFNMNHWGSFNYGGWHGCDMRYDILGSTDEPPTGYGKAATSTRVGKDPSFTCATTPVANTLMGAFPSDLRAVMKPMTKYADGKGDSSDVEANVVATIDYLPLLAEFEIFGERKYANQHEQYKQKQYDYYANGNNKSKYNHLQPDSSERWWSRSALSNNKQGFCDVAYGAQNGIAAGKVSGIAPIFKV